MVEAFAARGGHDVVRTLEERAALTAPDPRAPSTGPAVLTHRVLARVLTSLGDDRHAWDARNGQIDTSSYGSGLHPALVTFPTVVEALREARPDPFGAPGYRFWILLRADEPVAVLDADGRVHLPGTAPRELLPVYRAAKRSLTLTIAQTLGSLLP